MSNEQPTLATRVADLRRSFDESFTKRPQEPAADESSYLGIRLGEGRYVVRLEEVGGIFVDRVVAPLKGRLPELLGMAGIRGNVVPVFALGRLLGEPPATSIPRWLLVAAHSAVGFAFDAFDGYLKAPASAVAAAEGESFKFSAREILRVGTEARTIVGIQRLIEAIGNRAGVATAHKEH